MLGKLFSLTGAGASSGSGASPHASQPPSASEPLSSLDSVQEDLHTRSLLYPDAQSLFQNHHDQVFPLADSAEFPVATSLASAFDLDGDLDLDMRDIRVLIMQDGISSLPPSLLYDSHPTPPPPAPSVPDRPSTMAGMSHLSYGFQDISRRVPTSPRKPSLGHAARPVVIQPDSPQLRQSATFDRRPSLHTRSHSRLETEAQRVYREYLDEVSVLSSCIFGNSELLAYRGMSTKVHILPTDPRAADLSSSILHDGRGSLGRSSMRSSKLSQSFSSESAAMFPQAPTSSSSSLAGGSRSAFHKRVLITRLFPVTLPNDDDSSQATSPYGRVDEADNVGGYPFPTTKDDSTFPKKKKKSQLRQKRTPMYAIALIVSLPQPPPPSAQVSSASRTTFRGPGSYTEQDSFPSSYGSGRRVGWALATAALGGGADTSTSDSATGAGSGLGVIGASTTDIEERMDPITQHWDIIIRALTQLQTTASATILALLRVLDIPSPDPSMAFVARASFHGKRRSEESVGLKTPKMNAKLVTLMPNALMDIDRVSREADNARCRITIGLRALRVVTGQNRWGIWREEARWVTRWAASVRERKQHPRSFSPQLQPSPLPPPPQQTSDQFLYNLLTAFLSTHTDWLQALSPARYRKRHVTQTTRGNDDNLPARTIIVSRDKIAARRAVFLLSAFLPAAPGLASNNVRIHRPSTSMSWGALSQSPPSFVVPIIKEQSLRRKINRRGAGGSGRRSSHSRNLSLQGQAIAGSASAQRSASMSVTGAPAPLAQRSLYGARHERRPSDAASIRTANLPLTGSDLATRKSSTATTTTITSDATIPHFASFQRSESSLAADDLKRTLERSDSSTGHQSPTLPRQFYDTEMDPRSQSLRWGNMLTGFLSGRRRDSATGSVGGTHSRNSSLSSWDPLGKRTSIPPVSPVKPHPELRPHDGQRADSSRQSSQGGTTGPDNGLPTAVLPSADIVGPHTPRLPQDSPNLTGNPFVRSEAFRRAPDPGPGFESPVKATVEAEDGVIDVDITFPDFMRSFETAVSSPSSSGFLSTPGFESSLDTFEQSFRVAVGDVPPVNVAGWLQSYHPDFSLQAIPPQGNLLAQVKESLRTEPSPSDLAAEAELLQGAGQRQAQEGGIGERWVDISSAIIVDTANLAITRVTYSRLIRTKPVIDASTPNSGNGPSATVAGAPPTAAPSQETQLIDERFVEEPIMSTDSVLMRAIERVIAQGVAGTGHFSSGGPGDNRVGTDHVTSGGGLGGDSAADSSGISTGDSARSSRSASIKRGRRGSSSVGPDEAHPLRPRYVNPSPTAPYPPLTPLGLEEVPRAECKTVILSALEEIVREVVENKDRDERTDDSEEGGAKDEDGEPSVLRHAVQVWLESVDMGEV